MAQTLMIASGKGGTGKSTFASFAALEYALKGKKTLLIELDAGMRSIDIITGITNQAVFDIGDVLCGRCSAQKAMIDSPHSDNLKIITAPYKATEEGFENFRRVVASVSPDFDYILIDTRAGMGTPFYTACTCAGMGIIVVTPDIISVRDGRLVSDEMFKNGVNDVRVIINKFSPETFRYSGLRDLDTVIDETCARLLGVIPMSEKIATSSINGTVLSVQDKEKQIFSAISRRIRGSDIAVLI